jgi:hypothetical protein
MVVCVEGTTHSVVEIYTLRSGAWRSFMAPSPPYYFREPFGRNSLRNIFFNGAVHWPTHTPEHHQGPFCHLIVSLDMEDEVLRTNSEQSWYLHIYDISDWLYFDSYVESLALLNVANGVLGVQVTLSYVSMLKAKEKKRKRKI